MSTQVSPNMNIAVPVPLSELGPQWAADIQTALYTTIDLHDHSSGKGVQIRPAGLNINADLTFNSNNAIALRSSRYTSQSAALALGTDVGCWSNVNGDAYWNNSVGTAIQVTKNGSVNGSFSSWSSHSVSALSSYTILSSDQFQLYFVSPNAGGTSIQLPTSASVGLGRMYVFVDLSLSSGTNPITFLRASTDTINGATQFVCAQNGATVTLYTDGAGHWTASVQEATATGFIYGPPKLVSASYTCDTTAGELDTIVGVHTNSGAYTITLPTPTVGRTIIVEDYDGNAQANNITVAPHSIESINGNTANRVCRSAFGKWTFVSDGTNWICQGSGKLCYQQFTSSGTFTAYDTGLYLIIGWGGGGAGGSGGAGATQTNLSGGGGGGGSTPGFAFMNLASGGTAAVTIGTHANGGAATSGTSVGNVGAQGPSTTFGNSSQIRFPGGSGGGAGGTANTSAYGGMPGVSTTNGNVYTGTQGNSSGGSFSDHGTNLRAIVPGCGGATTPGASGDPGCDGIGIMGAGGQGGGGGAINGGLEGGGGGGGGPGGNGGAGGSGATASAGQSAAANSGAGGGGGTAALTTGVSGAGGNGGTGYLIVIWVD